MKFRAFLAALLLSCTTAFAVSQPEVYFSRSDPISKIIAQEIGSARKTIHLLIYSLTDDSLAHALVEASKRGVDVRIVFDKSQSAGKYSLADELEEQLGPLKVQIRSGKGRGIMHEKMAIFDGITIALGSYNWTDNAKDNNWENLIVINDARLAAECEKEFQDVWASAPPKPPAKPKTKSGERSGTPKKK